jgi:hypothetical protein
MTTDIVVINEDGLRQRHGYHGSLYGCYGVLGEREGYGFVLEEPPTFLDYDDKLLGKVLHHGQFIQIPHGEIIDLQDGTYRVDISKSSSQARE